MNTYTNTSSSKLASEHCQLTGLGREIVSNFESTQCRKPVLALLLAIVVSGCGSANNQVTDTDDHNNYTDGNVSVLPTYGTNSGDDGVEPVVDPNTVFPSEASNIMPFSVLYQQDGYGDINVIRVDAKIKLAPGECTENDYTGCTLADVLNDTSHKDDFDPEVQILFTADDFPDSGEFTNASFRQRGGTTRKADQKSFRIKLDDKNTLWRGERRLFLNKHPFELTRIRNKVAFDLMSEIPNLRSMRTQFVNLWIDEGTGPVDYGLFTHVEAASEEYLKLRGLDKNDRLYKTGHFGFKESDLNNLRVDEEGRPVDEKLFEKTLEIKSGKDHRKLYEMLSAVHNPDITFDALLDKYFDRNNVLTWITLNFLVHQSDAVTHNYILYNPKNSDKFYFLPWDYDGALVNESEPPNSMSHADLQKRLFFGYARGIHNVFITRYYKQPNIHQKIIAAAEELRRNYLTDESINSKASRYAEVVSPYVTSSPDIDHNPGYNVYATEGFAKAVAENLALMQNHYSVPMPPEVNDPVRDGDDWVISWAPAYDVTGNYITYELMISSSINFEPDSIVYSQSVNNNNDTPMEIRVSESYITAGEWYVRVIARSSKDPSRYWQVNDNVIYTDTASYYGVLAFSSID